MSLDNPNAAALAAIISNTVPGAANILNGGGIFSPIVSPRDYFLQVLEDWYTSIPMGTQWIIFINPFPTAVTTTVIQNLERIDGSKNEWDIDQAVSILTSNANQVVQGCIFAQNVAIPPERFSYDQISINNSRGFLPGLIGKARDFSAQTLNIDLLETNTSFVDFVVRPWVILGSHFGMVARPGDTPTSRDPNNMKSTITVMQYAKTLQNVNMVPRKVWTFFNCMPVQTGNENLDYKGEPGEPITYNTQWVYTNYTIENNLYLPIADIVNNIG